MKSILLAAMLLISVTAVKAQDVDRFVGFDDLKLGMSKSSLKGYLTDNQDGTFQFVKDCCHDLLGVPVKFVLLKFDAGGKVNSITVRMATRLFVQSQITEYTDKITKTVNSAPEETRTPNVHKSFRWSGTKMVITLIVFISELPPGSADPVYAAEIEISKK